MPVKSGAKVYLFFQNTNSKNHLNHKFKQIFLFQEVFEEKKEP